MEPKGTGLRFKEYGIADVLKIYELTVPLNQRSYAWDEDRVQRLLDDLGKAFYNSIEQIYFLGTIVLTYGEKDRLEIADGQQRLATISIIIAAIRDYLLSCKDLKGANKCQEDYLIEYKMESGDYSPKLLLNYEDNDYFYKRILKSPTEREDYTGPDFDSNGRLAKASELAKNHLDKITAVFSQEQEKRGRVIEWLNFLKTQAMVILITVPGKIGNAFKMFETLNARGIEASQTDILKNYLYEKAKSKMVEIHPHWISMLTMIESLGEDDLLKKYIRHYWIAHHGPTTERDLGDEIEKSIQSERQALDLVTSLDSFAGIYIALHTPREHPFFSTFSTEIQNCIFTITRELGVEQILPLLLAIAKYFPNKSDKPNAEAEKAFELCLSWSVRFLISGGGGGGVLDRHYGLRAKEISAREITTAKELSARMKTVVPNNEVFQSSFETASIRRKNLARYYLRAIDLFQKNEPKPQFIPNPDVAAVTAEHVLPVNRSKEWDIDPDIAASYYKRLGNIVLLGAKDNVKIGNKSFAEKKKVIKDSPYEATAWVAEYEKWGKEEIIKRQKRLAELAPEVWPI